MSQNKKWLDLGLGALSLAFGFLAWALIDVLWKFFKLPLFESFPVSFPAFLAFILAVGCFVVLKRHKQINEFGFEVIVELSKVSWPPRKETALSTGVIIVMVAIASVLLFSFDQVWGFLTRKFLE